MKFKITWILNILISYISKKEKKEVKLLSCVWLCYLMDYSLPGSSVHGIFQARILEWVSISFSENFFFNHKL